MQQRRGYAAHPEERRRKGAVLSNRGRIEDVPALVSYGDPWRPLAGRIDMQGTYLVALHVALLADEAESR